ncbi:MAG: C40 family peptidase [Acidiferrobacterales bacterium]
MLNSKRAAAVLPLLVSTLLAACSSQPPRPTPTARDLPVNAAAVQHALRMVGAPYRYGGNTPRGFDCSGLVQYSYARAGVVIPRTTREQRKRARSVAAKKMRPGDLVFFTLEGKRASHVGLYIGGQRFVHAPATGKTVHVSQLSNPYWRRHFIGVRRFDF